MRRSSAWLALLCAATVYAQVPFDVAGFTKPLPGVTERAATCAACHPREAASWSQSRHRASLTNAHFLDGLKAEPHVRCVVCHAPLEPQTSDVLRAQSQLLRVGVEALPAESLAHEGITCAVCHVRDGVVLVPNARTRPYGHAVKYEPTLTTSEFCGACHEFSGHAVVDGVTRLNTLPMQTTLSEWRAWGGKATCQDCHMPQRSHAVRGAHDEAFVRSAVSLKLVKGRATVLAHDVGHAVPTGDVFRHLVLWADDQVLAKFGLEFEPRVDDAGVPGLAVRRDTRLWPEVPQAFEVPRGAKVVRLTMHLTEVSGRERFGLTREDEVYEVARLPTR